VLNNKVVERITPFLDDSDLLPAAKKLGENFKRSFVGSYVLGLGFTMRPSEAAELIQREARNADALRPYLNGSDQNSDPSQSPSRWVIHFFDWELAKAETYPDLLDIVKEKVKPERDQLGTNATAIDRKRRWWQFARSTLQLYDCISRFDRVLVTCKHGKYASFAFHEKPTIVFDIALVVFAIGDYARFSVLQSDLHHHWARKYGSTIRSDLRYTPSDVFETFPFPEEPESKFNLAQVGEAYHEHRRLLMLRMQLGLTKTYNLFHDPNLSPEVVAKASKQDADVAAEAYSGLIRLRELHLDMDNAVLTAYGWHESSDDGPVINLRHDFYEVDYLPENDRTRYTIHPDARRELLKRLLLLNHRRYAEEQAAAKTPRPAEGKKKSSATKSARGKQAGPSLFSGDDPIETL